MQSQNGNIWYSCQPRGRHLLGEVVKKLCDKAGLTRKRTNHSCRASSTTQMYECGADEQLICERTGHQSIAVRSYKRTSNNQLREVSNMLYGNVSTDGKPSSTVSKVENVENEVKVPKLETKVEESCGETDSKNVEVQV